jgi:protein-tyrosine-phosphatase
MSTITTGVRFAVAAVSLFALSASAGTSQPQDPSATRRTQTVLFMCPRGAAKSVLASAYFQRLARERGLNVRVESAGTEPDPAVSPAVAAHLARKGYDLPNAAPRKVNPQDLASADVVVSIGCDLSRLPHPRGTLRRWDDVPALSEEFARADETIRKLVSNLVDELVRASRQGK